MTTPVPMPLTCRKPSEAANSTLLGETVLRPWMFTTAGRACSIAVTIAVRRSDEPSPTATEPHSDATQTTPPSKTERPFPNRGDCTWPGIGSSSKMVNHPTLVEGRQVSAGLPGARTP